MSSYNKNKLLTKNYFQKLLAYRLFGKKSYRLIKFLKIFFFHIIGKNYEVADFLKLYSSEDTVIFDIGANLGQYALRLNSTKKNVKIYSFEPVKENFDILIGFQKYFELGKVELHNLAVGSFSGETEILIPLIDNEIEVDTQATIDNRKRDSSFSNYRRQKIQITTIDDFVKKLGISKIDVIKTDTEGNDENVIKGGMKTITEFYPLILIEESYRENWLNHLYQLGYKPYYCTADNKKIIKAENSEFMSKEICYDLLVLIHDNKLSYFVKNNMTVNK